MKRQRQFSVTAIAAAITVVAAASAAVATTAPEPVTGYQATIMRDGAGVPHIVADDLGSLAFGQGYALAEDRSCTLLDQVVKVRGERAKYLGRGVDDANVDSDFAYHHLGLWANAPERWANQSDDVQALISGYVAGFNAGLDEAGPGVACAGADWVGPITEQDYYAVVSDIVQLASSRQLVTEIGSATPPTATAATSTPASTPPTTAESMAGLAKLDHDPALGSNGWALGAERSTTGGGIVLGNPHFPWEGELRFWESHLVIPGEVNVYGVSLTGLAGVQIGFNDAVAWTHTVSAGKRFNLYRYQLDPADPTVYLVDGAPEQMVAADYTIEVLGDDGTTTTESRTLYRTKHGPVVDIDPLGWTAEQAIAIADANAEIDRVLAQFLGMDRATSMDEFQQVHTDEQGIPWVNTISASADGRAWYTDVSATPNLSPEALEAWQAERAEGGLAALAYDAFGVIVLDGSNSLFDWVDDPSAPAPGLVPAAATPALERGDYVFNANDTYRWTNPTEQLTGFTFFQGDEEAPPSARTRTNLTLLGESAEPWDLDDTQQALLSGRTVLSESLLDPLVEACTATPMVELAGSMVDVSAACAALASWDGTYTVDATGAIIFREWLARFDWLAFSDAGPLFADEFDPADPAGTPSEPAADRDEWLRQLASAVQYLGFVGVPVDAPLGDYQFEIRSGQRIPMPGGGGLDGVANILDAGTLSSSSLEAADDGIQPQPNSPLRQLPDGTFGYPVNYGASFVYTVQYTDDGPVAEGFLTFGNPDDPADPNYTAGLEQFSNGDWRSLTFDVADLEGDPSVTITEVGS